MNNSGTTVVQVAGAVVTALAQVGVPGVAGPLNSPTGTGFVHTTAGAIDAAARAVNLASNGVGGDVTGVAAISNGGTGLSALGTALQVLQVNSGGTALVYGNVPLATVVAPTGSGVAMVASGVWVAAASLGTAGQILVSTTAPASAAVWVTASQDATLTASGAFTVTGIQTNTVTSGSLVKGDLFIATTTSNWAAVAATGDVVFSTSTPGLTSVQHLYGASVPAGSGLTTGNVLQVSGAAALTYGAVNLAGGSAYVIGALPVTNIVPSGTTGDVLTTTVGGTTVAWAAIPSTPAGTAGQIYVTNSATVATWATMTGDAVISSAAVLRVESLQYGQTAAATIDASAGTINFALGASAVGITQTTITSTATPFNMVFTPQTSTHASGTTGHVIFNFQAPTAAASYNTVGRLKCQTGGVTTFAVGGADAYWGNAIFFGDPGASNAVIFNNGNANYTFFNAGSLLAGTVGGAYYIFQGTTSDIKFGSNLPNANFSFGAPTTDSSSGGAIYIAAAATNPTHAISGSCAIYSDHTTGAFSVYPPGVTSYAFGVGSYGSGVGVVSIQAAATVPTTAPSGGGVLYCGNGAGDAKVINWWDTDTSNIAIAASGSNAGIIFTQHTGAQVNIGIATASSGNGQELAIGAGSTSAATGAAGGALYLNSGGSSNAGGGSSGNVTLATGVSVGSSSGQIILKTGTAASSVGNISLSPGGTLVMSCQAALVGMTQPIGGLSTSSTFSFSRTPSAIAFSTGGTHNVTTSEMATPVLTLTSGTLTSNAILDFSTVCTTTPRPGFFLLDVSGFSIGATFGLVLTNGSATYTITSANAPIGNLIAVVIQGANLLCYR